MTATCPDCDEPLALGGRFCKACGWDAELEAADDEGLAAELPESLTDEEYEDILHQEGLGPPTNRVKIVAILVLLALLLMFLIRLAR